MESTGVGDRIYRTLKYQEIGHCRVLDVASDPGSEEIDSRLSEITELCNLLAWDEAARVVVLAFDGEISGTPARRSIERPSLVAPVGGLKLPVIAAIRGNAAGLGLELALACDIRIGTEGARFGFPQIGDSCIPSEGGTQRLPRLIGQGRALQMILTGELIDATEANRIGLVHRVVSPDALMDCAMQLALEMAEKSPLSLSYAKEALYGGSDLTLDQGLKLELDLYLHLFTTLDRTKGITAFKEKKKPKFEGI
jgi:enoyl-CoA hydratase